MSRIKNHCILLGLSFSLLLSILCISTSHANEVLQTQYGPNGIEVDLVRAKKSGKILSVVFSFRSKKERGDALLLPIKEVHFIDNVESKKYHVLKDDKGEWLCAPIVHSGGAFTNVVIPDVGNMIVWYKFPLPPEKITRIQINLPQISPFDDVVISR